MSYETPQTCLLESLAALNQVQIRPFSRSGCDVAFMVFYLGKKPESRGSRINPVICTLEGNESTEHVRIKIGNDDTKIVANGGLLSRNKMNISYSYDANKVLGVIDGDNLTDTSVSSNRVKYKASHVPFRGHSTWHLKTESGLMRGVVNCSPNASGVRVNLYDYIPTSSTKLLFMLFGLVCLYQKYRFHQHPIPTNLYPAALTGSPIAPQLAVLRGLRHLLLRMSFFDEHGHLFMDYLDIQTHEVRLIVEFTFDDLHTVVFKDLFGTAHFVAKEFRDDPRGFTVFTTQTANSLGKLVGFFNREMDQSDYFDGDTNHNIMIETPKTTDNSDWKICPPGRDAPAICEYIAVNSFFMLKIDFLQDTSDKNKALILARLPVKALRFHKYGQSSIPSISVYPFQLTPGASN